MNWIKVEDDLPPFGEEVIVFGEHRTASPQMGGAYQFMTERVDLSHLKPDIYLIRLLDENQFKNARYVTHWMHKPKNPQL